MAKNTANRTQGAKPLMDHAEITAVARGAKKTGNINSVTSIRKSRKVGEVEMGITERHWFEDEEPELTERQLEDIVYENKKAYDNGYIKGYSDRDKEIVRCKDCKHWESEDGKYGICKICHSVSSSNGWFCADGERQ